MECICVAAQYARSFLRNVRFDNIYLTKAFFAHDELWAETQGVARVNLSKAESHRLRDLWTLRPSARQIIPLVFCLLCFAHVFALADRTISNGPTPQELLTFDSISIDSNGSYTTLEQHVKAIHFCVRISVCVCCSNRQLGLSNDRERNTHRVGPARGRCPAAGYEMAESAQLNRHERHRQSARRKDNIYKQRLRLQSYGPTFVCSCLIRSLVAAFSQ